MMYLGEGTSVSVHGGSKDPLLAQGQHCSERLAQPVHLVLHVAHQVRGDEARVQAVGRHAAAGSLGAEGQLVGEQDVGELALTVSSAATRK